MSTYQIDRNKQRQYAEQNNWILFPDEFSCTNYAKKVALDIEIELGRTPVLHALDGDFWDRHFHTFTCPELKAKCRALGIPFKPNAPKQVVIGALTRYFRAIVVH